MDISVTDFLLVTGYPTDDLDPPPAGWAGPVELPHGVRIEELAAGLATRLMDACELRGERWDPARQFRCIYAFVIEVPEAQWQQNLYSWDDGHALYNALALSRLVRPQATACDYAVRRIAQVGREDRLVPCDAQEARAAFRVEDGTPDWLNVEEADELGSLIDAYTNATLPPRVTRAFRLAELAVRERYLEDALPVVVTGLEALLKVGRRHLSAQFEQRCAGLAGELGLSLTQDQCGQAYDNRSAVVHGGDVDLSAKPVRTAFLATFELLQATLRLSIRRAIEDSAFAAAFADDGRIKECWPTIITSNSGTISEV